MAEPLPEEKTDDEQSQQPPSIHKQESKVSSQSAGSKSSKSSKTSAKSDAKHEKEEELVKKQSTKELSVRVSEKHAGEPEPKASEEKKKQSTGGVSFKPAAQTEYNDYTENSWTAAKKTNVRGSKQSEIGSRKLTTPSVAGGASRKSTAPVIQPKTFVPTVNPQTEEKIEKV